MPGVQLDSHLESAVCKNGLLSVCVTIQPGDLKPGDYCNYKYY